MRKSLEKLAEKGGADPDEVLARVTAVDEIAPADLMVEAVIEDFEIKQDVFRRADAALPPEAILASNTSSIPITSLAAATQRPDRVIGMHFFNPVPVLKLVEVVRGRETSDETAAAIVALAERSARRRRSRTTSPASSRTGSSCRTSTRPCGRCTTASPSRRRSTRSRSSASRTRWARSRSPT